MKVMELIEVLQDQDPDLEVMVAFDYGDYHGTHVAEEVHVCGEAELREDLGRKGWVCVGEEEEGKRVVVISKNWMV